MEMRERVAEWAARMGYVGAIPRNFEHMCTPKTAHVWEQLMCKARPRADVEKIRHNILMHRVNNPSEVNDLLYPPVRELELFQQKRKLEEEIKNVEDDVAELDRKINHASVQNKIKYLQVDNAGAKAKEAQHKTFLLESKSRALRGDLAQAREKLAVCEGLTPEPTTAQTKEEVLNTLKKHADKIGGLISESKEGPDLTAGEIREFEEDESLLKEIKGVLRRSDNRLLWGVLLEAMNGSRIDLRSLVGMELEEINVTMLPEDNSGAEDALHVGFVEAELSAMLHERDAKKLRAELDGQRGRIFDALRKANLQENVADDAAKLLLLRTENAGLKAACDVVAAQIRASSAAPSGGSAALELQEERGKSLDVQQRIVDVFRAVEFKGRLCERVHARLLEVRSEVPTRALKLVPLVGDVRWARPLADDVAVEEIRVFNRFSLERNRRIAATGSMAKLVTDDLVGCEDLDGNSLYMLAATVDRPFSPSETALLALIGEMAKLSVQRALPGASDVPALDYKKYDLEEFKAQEAHVERSVCRLGALMKPSNAGRVLSTLSKVKREAELWLETPLGDFVDGKRLFDGRSFDHYQSSYNSHYNQLQ